MLPRSIFIMPDQRKYMENLLRQFPDRPDEQPSGIRANLQLSAADRLRRMSRYSKLLLQMFPGQQARLEACLVTPKIAQVVDDYAAGMDATDAEKVELALWAADRLLPKFYDKRHAARVKKEVTIAGLEATIRTQKSQESSAAS